MPTHVILADVAGEEFQNPQELTSIWGALRNDIENLGGELADSYAVIGDYDFLLTVDAPDSDTALQIALAVERHGLDTKTMQVFPVERLSDLVEDV